MKKSDVLMIKYMHTKYCISYCKEYVYGVIS